MVNENYALAIDTKLQNGKFVVKKVLGQGGFGITYLCEHVLLGKVVVKELFLFQACARDDGRDTVKSLISSDQFSLYKDRFLDEAKTLVKLKHIDGIVHVFDFFEENNTVYFAMEYIDATPLLDVVYQYRKKQEKMPEELAIRIIADVSIALKKVHAVGILHRDIKPHNILVGENGKPYLIDFGISRTFQEGKTDFHTTMATPGYSAPEQMTESGKKSATLDIYALGATLYFCLTERHPQTLAEIAIHGYVQPKEVNPNITYRTNDAIVKAMALKSENRFQNIDEWLNALGVEKGRLHHDNPIDKENAPPHRVHPENSAATQVITNKSASSPPPSFPKPESTNWKKLVLPVVVILGIFGLYKSFAPQAKPKKKVTFETAPNHTEMGGPKLSNNALTVDWTEDENSKGLIPEWQELMFTPYDRSFAATVTGYLKLDKIEVSKLSLLMAFFDENDVLLHSQSYEPIPQGDEIIYRSGDLIPIHLLVYEDKQATKAWKKVKIKVDFIQKDNVPGNTFKAKPLPVKWVNENDNYKIAIKSRLDNISGAGFQKDKSFHKMEYEISNIGNASFKLLKFSLNYYNKKGKLLDKCERYLMTEGDPILKVGQTRLFYSTCGFDAPQSEFDHFEVVVAEYR